MAQGRFREGNPELAVQFLLGIVVQPAIGAIYGNVSRPVIQHLPALMDAVERVLCPVEAGVGG